MLITSLYVPLPKAKNAKSDKNANEINTTTYICIVESPHSTASVPPYAAGREQCLTLY